MVSRYLLPKGSLGIIAYYRNIPFHVVDIVEWMLKIGSTYLTEYDIILTMDLSARQTRDQEKVFVWLDGLTYIATQHTDVNWVFGCNISELISI